MKYSEAFSELLEHDIFGLAGDEKQQALMPVMQALHAHHYDHSEAYRKLAAGFQIHSDSLSSWPYVAVRLFKQFTLSSVPDTEVFRILQSSGTTGQTPARVVLDKATSARQSKVLVKIMQNFIGRQRLPMLIIDSPSVLKDRTLSARAAGIQGMAFFGRQPVYALNDDMTINHAALSTFIDQHGQSPVLVFGFTFMVWKYFVRALQQADQQYSLLKATLIHSGGWKKLVEEQVDNATFKQTLQAVAGIRHVHNFYGMAEQVGTVFVECEHGHLHVPSLADIIVRHPHTLAEQPVGKPGLIQVISAIPTSYPGYSLLTEDMGRLIAENGCGCGRAGKYFEIHGRLPKTEVRGCSDTQTHV